MPVTIQLSSDAEAVLVKVRGFNMRMQDAIRYAMDAENQLTVSHVQQNYLTGPRPEKLGVVTNRLRSSIRASLARPTVTTVSSKIGTNVKYAAAHEYGFDGMVTVRQHTRKNVRDDVFDLGLGISAKRSEIAEFTYMTPKGRLKKGIKKVASAIVTVRSHQRHMSMPARPFLAPAFEDRLPEYTESISEAVLAAWNGGRS